MKHFLPLLIILPMLCSCGRHGGPQACYSPEEYDARIGAYYNYSTVDWALLDTLYYRAYNSDWPKEYEATVGENHLSEVDGRYWHLLQNARTKFHQDNLPLRSTSSPRRVAALDRIEAGFDTVFVRYMQEDYYLRSFVDAYQAVMPDMIDEL